MREEEWTSGMMVADEQILGLVEEIEQTIASAKDTFKVMLGGKVLYRESDLQDILQRNYVPATRHIY